MITVGTRIDGYAIEQRLGTGASAEVFLARDDALQRQVVIKRAREARHDALLEREATLLSRAGQRGLLQIYGRGSHEGRTYLVLERVEGTALSELLAQGPLARVDALHVARDVAAALAALHDADIVHRDVKPANVIVADNEGRAAGRLVDLGAATLGSSSSDEDAPDLGTPAYLAAERRDGAAASTASDVWSLGVLLHESVCGTRPRRGADLLTSATPPLSHELREITTRCLAESPDDRPGAGALAAALDAEISRVPRAFDCPFVGAMPYDTAQAALFFGRDAEVARLAAMVRAPGAVALVGASGAGKTSLLRAGLAPRLSSTGAWRVLWLPVSRQPLLGLARLIAHAERGAAGDGSEDARAIARRAQLLAEAPAMAALMLDDLAPPEGKLLLVVDDLELLLEADHAAASALLEALAVAGAGDGPARVVVAARDVVLGKLAELGAAPLLERVLALGEPSAHEIAHGIERVAALFDYRFEPAELANEIADEVAGRPPGLALLQLALHALWTRRDERRRVLRASDYAALGGVSGALEQQAERALAKLGDDERVAARRVLLALLDERGSPQTRARADLVDRGGERVVDSLLRERVLVRRRKGAQCGESPDAAEQPVLALAHEALAGWQKLRSWRESDLLAHAVARELERAAALWHGRGERPAELWDVAALTELERILPHGKADAGGELVARFVAASRARGQRLRSRRRGLTVAALVALLAVVGASGYLAATRSRDGTGSASGANSGSLRGGVSAAARQPAATSPAARTRSRRVRRALRRAGAAERVGRIAHARAYLRWALELTDSEAIRAMWWRLRPPPVIARWPLRRTPRALVSSASGRRLAVLDARVTAIFALPAPRADLRALGALPVRRRLLGALPAALALRFIGRHGVALVEPGGKLLYFARAKGPSRTLSRASAKTELAVARDGQTLAALDLRRAGSRRPRLRAWHLHGERVRQLAALSPVPADCAARRVAFTSTQRLVLGCSDGRLLQLSLRREPPQTLGAHGAAVQHLAVSPDGARLASADHGSLQIYALPSRRLVAARALRGVRSLAFFANGELLVHGADGRALQLDARGAIRDDRYVGDSVAALAGARLARARGAVVEVLGGTRARWRHGVKHGHRAPTRDVAISRDGSLLASVGGERALQLWGARGRPLSRLPLPSRASALCVGAGGVLVGDTAGRVMQMGLDGTINNARVVHQKRVTALRCLADGRVLSAGADGRLFAFEPSKPHVKPRLLHRMRSAVRAFALGPRQLLAVAARGGTLTRLMLGAHGGADALAGNPLGARGTLADVAISRDGRWIAAVGPRELLISSRDGTSVRRLVGSSGARIAFLPDDLKNRGALLLVDGAGRRQRIDPSSARQSGLRRADERWRLTRLVPTTRALLGAARDGTVRRWDLDLNPLARDDERPAAQPTAQRSVSLRWPASAATSSAKLRATLEGDALLVRRDDGSQLARRALGPGATCLAAASDGLLAVGMLDGSVELRHVASTLRARLPASPTAVTSLRFGPRGTLLVARRGGAVTLWHAASRTRLFDARLHGSLTKVEPVDKRRWRLRSEFGDALVLDLSPFARQRCELLRVLWRHSSATVAGGRLRRRPPPASHRCAEAKRARAPSQRSTP